MANTVKIRAIGNSQGVTLPKALLEKYQLKEGDTLTTVETEDGILLKSHDPVFEEGMKQFNKFSAKYKNALRELAK
ncbi:MAG: AbrB/MazE/SpoVT family DNA-binding domain-containing protein [Spirochaetes bacterium]|nr:AbrB/MazE/SpoVT family DNA-binding domain-containing protein [Spirochaetota bacterium]